MREPFGPDTVGAVIADARLHHGPGRKQLARLVGASPSQVTRWEQAAFVPSPEMLAKLAKVLELRASELFERAGIPIPDDKASIPAMLRSEYNLPPEAIQSIEQHITKVAENYREQQ